jgi:ribose transport system substrate-binding protein
MVGSAVTRFGCIVAAMMAVGVAGCGQSRHDGHKVTVGLVVPSLAHPFFIHLKDHVLDEARQLGVEVIAADAEDAAARQMSIVEDFISRGVDGVLISPIGADALVPAIESLNQAQIPVATVDRKVNGGEVLVHVGADNVEGGRAAARYILEKLGRKGNAIELEGTPGSSPAIDRRKGFHAEIDASGVNVVARQTADFQRAKGQAVMENLLQVHRDFQALFAANDEMILGAVEAMEAHHIEHAKVVTVGYDAIPDALDYIRQGRLDATIEQFPGRQARSALRILVEYIQNAKKPASPEVYIQPRVIDAGNLDQAEAKNR